MNNYFNKYFVLVILNLILLTIGTEPTDSRVPLILLGVDGYGYDLYKEYGDKNNGFTNVFPVQPVYPSNSFPNFMSIATGLYPTQHGIISNYFYNPKQDAYFVNEDDQADDFDWYKGEPIWTTAKLAGLRVYTDGYIGAAAHYAGVVPDIYSKFNGSKQFEDMVTDVVANMDNELLRCDLYVFYTTQPDYALHLADMSNAGYVQDTIDKVEAHIKLLVTQLGERKYNLITVSDHGMSWFNTKHEIAEPLRQKAKIYYGGGTPMFYVDPASNITATTLKEDVQHYLRTHDMSGISAMVVKDMEPRFQLCGLEEEGTPDVILFSHVDVTATPYITQSGHGYDNKLPLMFGQVRVLGEAFKSVPNIADTPVNINTELYNLFCTVLNITPASNTGSLSTFDFLLRNPPSRPLNDSYHQIEPPCGDCVMMQGCYMVICLTLILALF